MVSVVWFGRIWTDLDRFGSNSEAASQEQPYFSALRLVRFPRLEILLRLTRRLEILLSNRRGCLDWGVR